MNNIQQLLPGFTLRNEADFVSFFSSESLKLVTSTLQRIVINKDNDSVYIFGLEGNGKSHLLQAVCHLAHQKNHTTLYLPLCDLKDYPPQDILDCAEDIDFVCIDDIDVIAGNQLWEEALFHLYNSRVTKLKPTFYSAAFPVNQLNLHLPDLQSRLALCLNFQVIGLSDEDKTQFIHFRSSQLGLTLNDACVQFIIQRSGRAIENLVFVLDKINKESLVAGRKITLPFIRSIFSG